MIETVQDALDEVLRRTPPCTCGTCCTRCVVALPLTVGAAGIPETVQTLGEDGCDLHHRVLEVEVPVLVRHTAFVLPGNARVFSEVRNDMFQQPDEWVVPQDAVVLVPYAVEIPDDITLD